MHLTVPAPSMATCAAGLTWLVPERMQLHHWGWQEDQSQFTAHANIWLCCWSDLLTSSCLLCSPGCLPPILPDAGSTRQVDVCCEGVHHHRSVGGNRPSGGRGSEELPLATISCCHCCCIMCMLPYKCTACELCGVKLFALAMCE